MTSALAFFRPRNSAFCSATRASASAAWVNLKREQMSPAAYTRGFDGLTLHGPTTFTKQTNAIAIDIPVLF